MSQRLRQPVRSGDALSVIERSRWVLPCPSEPCAWCGRRCGAPLPLRQAASYTTDPDRTSPPAPERICDVCAGLLGLTPYDLALDGPHAQADAFDAVRLLTGVEPLLPHRSRRRCTWCSRPARAGWCPTCTRLLDAAAHAAGATLLPALPADDVTTAHRQVAQVCAPRAA